MAFDLHVNGDFFNLLFFFFMFYLFPPFCNLNVVLQIGLLIFG